MKKTNSWGLIGYGNIGREVKRQISQPTVAKRLSLKEAPEFIIESKGLVDNDGQLLKKSFNDLKDYPDVVFVALPSTDDGKIAYGYITPILRAGKIVVTAEKGAMANYFDELKKLSDNFERLGINATVGGGTRLLNLAREYGQDVDNITQIHLALNGTLAAIMSWVAPLHGQRITLEEAVEKAVKLGYAEPGSESAYDVIRAEAEGDIPKKTAIFWNRLELSPKRIDWKNLKFNLTDADIAKSIGPDSPRRFIVSIYPPTYKLTSKDDVVGGFSVTHDGWQIVGGFQRLSANELFDNLFSLTGPGNGMVIGLGPNGSDGIYAVTGPGAGVQPTANAMIDDYVRLKRQ